MKSDHEKLVRVRKTLGLVSSCTITIDQAIASALSTIGGTVFDAKVKEMNQQVVWRVKLLRSGERVKVYVDATSGKILEAKAKRAVLEPYRKISPASPTISPASPTITLSNNH